MKIKWHVMAALLMLVIGVSAAPAQTQFEITPFIGYQFGGDFVDSWSYDDTVRGDIDESANYGLLLDIGIYEGLQFELMYSRQDTELVPDRRPPAGDWVTADILVEYYHAGVLYQWKYDKVVPYIAGSMGATRFDLDRYDSDTRFSVSAGGGVKLMFSPHVGIRLDGRFYSTYFEGNDRYDYDDDWDEYYTHSDSSFLNQWNCKGGLVFAF
jgi:hypothetical protein